ncbi:hypothetical protein JHU04_004280 [Brenneria sp. 4F2]|nr:hypothetical protein [Brenneria bubanii]
MLPASRAVLHAALGNGRHGAMPARAFRGANQPETSCRMALLSVYVLRIFILNKCYTFTIPSGTFSKNADQYDDYLRLAHQGNVFYTHKNLYKIPEQFSRLSTKGHWYFYAHKLFNGSYWIHWIADDNALILEPKYASQENRPIFIKSIISLLTILVSLVVFLFFVNSSPVFSLVAMVFFVPAFFIAVTNIPNLLSFYAPITKFSLKYLDRVKKHDFTFFTPPPSRRCAQASGRTYSEIITSNKGAVAQTEGIVHQVIEHTWSAMKGDDKVQYNAYFFTCSNRSLIMCWRDSEQVAAMGNPAFLKIPPPFMAINDRVSCIYENKERTTLLSCKLPVPTHKVIGLINLTDDSEYRLSGGGIAGIRPSTVLRYMP